MASDEFEHVQGHPIRSFRLEAVKGESRVCVIRLSSGRSGQGTVHDYLATRENLERMAAEFLRFAKTMPHTFQ